MIVPLPPVLAAVREYFDPCLIGAGVRDAVEGVTDILPYGMSLFGFECRLAADDARVDFGTSISSLDGSREILAQPPPGAASASTDRWQALRRMCAAWVESALLARFMPAAFTELDLDGAALPAEASLFGRLDWPRRTNWRDELAEAYAAGLVFLRACYGGDMDAAHLRAVDECVQALPPNAWLYGVAAMLGRPARNPRLGVWMPVWHLRAYAERLGFGSVTERLEAVVGDFPDARGPFVELAMDVAEPVSPRIGIEFTLDNAAPPRREPLLERLVERGLCSAEKAQALYAWPGSDMVRLPGVDWPCTIVRQVSHLKLVLEPAALQAKAYLYVTPAFRLCR